MTTKTKPPTTLPGEWKTAQYARAKRGAVLVLPEPQAKFVHPAGPGKRPDGLLWFEGPSRRNVAVDKVNLARMSTERLKLDGTELPMRDVRRGDKWLPWHK